MTVRRRKSSAEIRNIPFETDAEVSCVYTGWARPSRFASIAPLRKPSNLHHVSKLPARA